MPDSLTRRGFIARTGALLGLAPTFGLLGCARGEPPPAAAGRALATGRAFFREQEAAFVDAAVSRLIPKDELGPGALEANVTSFIDQQLAGPYGRAYRWYMEGPWPKPEATGSGGGDEAFAQGNKSPAQQSEASAEGTKGAGNHKAPSKTGQGYQLKQTPAELYRDAIAAIDQHCQQQSGKPFAQLSSAQQDDLLHQLEAGKVDLGELPGDTFFALLWQNTQEGFLADPVYEGNRDFAGWKLIGFPGPRYNYVYDIEKHGQRYDAPYVSLVGRDPNRRREAL
ncbi:MAG: gluconate 2-dehydrogenase subunit 3 family protein [Xanthomonadales bacterium]|nr:gluconate 2-dehydrogenase subunit 3 family protein [Xanthomonadales bacterium]